MNQHTRHILKLFLLLIETHSHSLFASDTYSIKIAKGDDIHSIIPFIAQERIREFRSYPYLYIGSLDEEIAYLKWVAQQKNSSVAIAYENTTPIGFLTGTDLVAYDQHFVGSLMLFEKEHLTPVSYYYFPEVIISPEHECSGEIIATQLFNALEKFAQDLGYTTGCFVTIVENDSHPLRPINYQSLDPLWCTLGYVKSSHYITDSWLTEQT